MLLSVFMKFSMKLVYYCSRKKSRTMILEQESLIKLNVGLVLNNSQIIPLLYIR